MENGISATSIAIKTAISFSFIGGRVGDMVFPFKSNKETVANDGRYGRKFNISDGGAKPEDMPPETASDGIAVLRVPARQPACGKCGRDDDKHAQGRHGR